MGTVYLRGSWSITIKCYFVRITNLGVTNSQYNIRIIMSLGTVFKGNLPSALLSNST